MLLNPHLTQRMAEERIKDRLREAEEARLIRAATSHKKARRWWPSVTLMLGSLLGLATLKQS